MREPNIHGGHRAEQGGRWVGGITVRWAAQGWWHRHTHPGLKVKHVQRHIQYIVCMLYTLQTFPYFISDFFFILQRIRVHVRCVFCVKALRNVLNSRFPN